MANYIINDNGAGEIAVFDDYSESFGKKTYHVYKDEDRRNYPYQEFFKRVFYEDKNNIIETVSILPNNAADEMCFVYGVGHNSNSSVFSAKDYFKVEVKRFFHAVDEDNKPFYEESTDTYYIRKRTNNRLMNGIKIRSDNIRSTKDERLERINKIKNSINRKQTITNTTNKIIDNYFETDGVYSPRVLGKISSNELHKEIEENYDEVRENVSRKWKVTDGLRKIGNTAVATGIVGGGLASTISSIQANEFTIGPIILGIGTAVITHHMLKSARMTLTDSKVGEIEKSYLDANYEQLTRHRR